MSDLATSAPLASLVPAPISPRNNGLGATPLPGSDRVALAHRTAVEFESYFVSSMLESMTTGMKADKMFGGGAGEDMFHSMLNQQYGAAIAARGSFGIADTVQKEILRMQEKASQ